VILLWEFVCFAVPHGGTGVDWLSASRQLAAKACSATPVDLWSKRTGVRVFCFALSPVKSCCNIYLKIWLQYGTPREPTTKRQPRTHKRHDKGQPQTTRPTTATETNNRQRPCPPWRRNRQKPATFDHSTSF